VAAPTLHLDKAVDFIALCYIDMRSRGVQPATPQGCGALQVCEAEGDSLHVDLLMG